MRILSSCLALIFLMLVPFASFPAEPKIDPIDQPFRRAPMAESSRSIVIPLSSNVFSAFDAERLRTHTVWTGSPLRLWGPPFHGSSDRFICDYEGKPLLKTGPHIGWWSEENNPITNINFKGITTLEKISFLYQINSAEIREVQSLEQQDGEWFFIRRLELANNKEPLHWLAATSLNEDLPQVKAIGGDIHVSTLMVDYPEVLHTELNGKGPNSGYRTNAIKGIENRVFIKIQPWTKTVRCDAALGSLKPGLMATQLKPPLVKVTSAPKPVPNADKFYLVEQFDLPAELELLITGMGWLNSKTLAVSTWPGEIYLVSGLENGAPVSYQRFASGLNEPVGLAVHNNEIFVTQKSELTRVVDQDTNGTADLFENINDDWGYNGNYHAFAMGPLIDRAGNFFVYLNGNRTAYEMPYMGWCVKIDAKTKVLEGFCSGLRSPNGYAFYQNELFMADNQGNWSAACKLNHLEKGKYYGHPSSWPSPRKQLEGDKDFSPPAVWFPYSLSKSASGITEISHESFGPFQGQLLVGDFQNALLTRVSLEKVDGAWQGAVWPFIKGFGSGVNRAVFGSDGRLYVGGGKGAHWASALGPKSGALDRVSFSGKIPFEVKHVRATKTGFVLEFTEEPDPTLSNDIDAYSISQFRYEYTSKYGSPEFDHQGKPNSSTILQVQATKVNKSTIELVVPSLKAGYVTAFDLNGWTSKDGQPIWHEKFHYTLNRIPN